MKATADILEVMESLNEALRDLDPWYENDEACVEAGLRRACLRDARDNVAAAFNNLLDAQRKD